MNSLPSSYFGSCLGEIAAGSSGLENRVDLEKYTQGWEGSVNGIAISSIAVVWFFLQHPPPSHFLGGGGGGTGRFVTSSRSVMTWDLGAGKNSSTS